MSSGFRSIRIYIPINGSQTIDFGFKVPEAIAIFPKCDNFTEQPLAIIQNGRLNRKAIKFYEGRLNYSFNKMRIREFQERDTMILFIEGLDGAPKKYSIEVKKTKASF